MASHWSNLRNSKKISGRMSGIGFRGGYEKGKTAGTYAVRKNLKPSQLRLEARLRQKLRSHNEFISHWFRHFSKAAHAQNTEALKEFGIPSWSDAAWESHQKDPTPLCSNVIVTSNDFSNKVSLKFYGKAMNSLITLLALRKSSNRPRKPLTLVVPSRFLIDLSQGP
ncbi:hypothetical protein PtA15_3A369 [Puccinia triticina]|uniref:Tet-like 2OG-Fe(II) oxygenase domain-containing protein n=1 Tax=Puccinia triticina TaxID=208348 RepID=A0ABY7CCQ4_9BASI|nr:uncharacterized protein PtA15_3A369 [Puccinia triticina]WAQ83003.1 hypothetical protein PtA15_3A369 [Puccinia triticina]